MYPMLSYPMYLETDNELTSFLSQLFRGTLYIHVLINNIIYFSTVLRVTYQIICPEMTRNVMSLSAKGRGMGHS